MDVSGWVWERCAPSACTRPCTISALALVKKKEKKKKEKKNRVSPTLSDVEKTQGSSLPRLLGCLPVNSGERPLPRLPQGKAQTRKCPRWETGLTLKKGSVADHGLGTLFWKVSLALDLFGVGAGHGF